MMGLRLAEGIDRAAFRRELAAEPEELLEGQRLRALADAGSLVLDDSGLRATATGRMRLDSLLGYLLP